MATTLEQHFMNRTDLPCPTGRIKTVKVTNVANVGFEIWVTQGSMDVWHPMGLLFPSKATANTMALAVSRELGPQCMAKLA